MEKFPAQDKCCCTGKRGLLGKLRTEHSRIHSQTQLQTQEAFILLIQHGSDNYFLKAIPTGKLVLCKQWHLEVREILERYWNVRKHPGSFWVCSLATRIRYQNLEGKNCIKVREREKQSLQILCRMPLQKKIILKCGDFILKSVKHLNCT